MFERFFKSSSCKSFCKEGYLLTQGRLKKGEVFAAFRCDDIDELGRPLKWVIDSKRCKEDQVLEVIRDTFSYQPSLLESEDFVSEYINDMGQDAWKHEDENRVKFKVNKVYRYRLDETEAVEFIVLKRSDRKVTIKDNLNKFEWKDGSAQKNLEENMCGHTIHNKNSECFKIKMKDKTELFFYANGKHFCIKQS